MMIMMLAMMVIIISIDALAIYQTTFDPMADFTALSHTQAEAAITAVKTWPTAHDQSQSRGLSKCRTAHAKNFVLVYRNMFKPNNNALTIIEVLFLGAVRIGNAPKDMKWCVSELNDVCQHCNALLCVCMCVCFICCFIHVDLPLKAA